MTQGDDFDFQLYRYVPSLPAAIAACAVFGLLTAAHTWRMVRARTWFCTPFVVGGLCTQGVSCLFSSANRSLLVELIGYIGRCLSHFDKEALGPYIIQSLLILLGPALFAASIYMSLSRIIRSVDGQTLSIIPERWQTRLFVLGDVLSFFLQMVGGGIQAAGTLDLLHMGEKIITVGLFVQIFFFGMFTVTSLIFNVRLRKQPTAKALEGRTSFQGMLIMLYVVSLLILVRSIFRVIEYIQGNTGYLLRNEIWLYIFDAILMALAMLVFLVYHPAQLIQPGNEGSVPLRSFDRADQV